MMQRSLRRLFWPTVVHCLAMKLIAPREQAGLTGSGPSWFGGYATDRCWLLLLRFNGVVDWWSAIQVSSALGGMGRAKR